MCQAVHFKNRSVIHNTKGKVKIRASTGIQCDRKSVKLIVFHVEITVNLFFFSFVKMTEQHVLTQLKLIFYKHYAGKVKNKEMF